MSAPKLEVLFTPADFDALATRDLSQTTCVVLDILRATTSMMTALANNAESIIPVQEISEALAIHRKTPSVLLAGERDGVRILRKLTGSVDFDLGNSPREFAVDKVSGRTIVMSTTNGTRALRACAHAAKVLIGSFLNIKAVVQWIQQQRPAEVILICSGTYEGAGYEDTLAAGAICAQLTDAGFAFDDTANMALQVFRSTNDNLLAAMTYARNGRRLLSIPELADDVPFALRRDTLTFVARMGADGSIRQMPQQC